MNNEMIRFLVILIILFSVGYYTNEYTHNSPVKTYCEYTNSDFINQQKIIEEQQILKEKYDLILKEVTKNKITTMKEAMK
jgi:hypothetical protein